MYAPYQHFQASPETIKAIEEATKGKIDALWEAEELIVQAILADASIPYMAKANEINRCMQRFLTTANNYGLSNSIFQGAYQPLGFAQAPMPMSGYGYGLNDLGMPHPYTQFQNPLQSLQEATHTTSYTIDTGITYHINTKRLGGKINSIDVSNNMGAILTAHVIGILNNYEDRDAIAIGVIASKDSFASPEVVDIVFRHIAETLGMDKDDQLYSYTVRKGDNDDSVLYIDMVEGCDSVDIENYSDLIRGNILTYNIFDDLFTHATDAPVNTIEDVPTGPGNSVE